MKDELVVQKIFGIPDITVLEWSHKWSHNEYRTFCLTVPGEIDWCCLKIGSLVFKVRAVSSQLRPDENGKSKRLCEIAQLIKMIYPFPGVAKLVMGVCPDLEPL